MRILFGLIIVGLVLFAAKRIYNICNPSSSKQFKQAEKDLKKEKDEYKKQLEDQEKAIAKEKSKL